MKLLQRIVDARQVNVRSRETLMSSIKAADSRNNTARNDYLRSQSRRQSELDQSNRKLAVKLFTSKPSVQAVTLEREYQTKK